MSREVTFVPDLQDKAGPARRRKRQFADQISRKAKARDWTAAQSDVSRRKDGRCSSSEGRRNLGKVN